MANFFVDQWNGAKKSADPGKAMLATIKSLSNSFSTEIIIPFHGKTVREASDKGMCPEWNDCYLKHFEFDLLSDFFCENPQKAKKYTEFLDAMYFIAQDLMNLESINEIKQIFDEWKLQEQLFTYGEAYYYWGKRHSVTLYGFVVRMARNEILTRAFLSKEAYFDPKKNDEQWSAWDECMRGEKEKEVEKK